jgi:hypothetical protein
VEGGGRSRSSDLPRFCPIDRATRAASGKSEEGSLNVMWRAYLEDKSKAQSGEKSSSGVSEHIYIGQYADDQTSLDYLNTCYYDS